MADLIARIYTCKNERGYEEGVIRSIDNRGRFVEALEERPSSHCSRETTAPLEESNDADHYHTNKKKKDLQYEPSIQLNFSDRPKGEMGLIFGRDSQACDVVLPNLFGVSRQHCFLTFDAQGRLILRDQSTRGTMVTYDEMDDKPRQGMTWILSGNPVPDSTDCIVIQINKLLKFQIVVPKRDSYTKAVSIWSLGVVIYEYAYGFPPDKLGTPGLCWCEYVVSRLHDQDDNMLIDTLKCMLVMDSKTRISVKPLLERVLKITLTFLFSKPHDSSWSQLDTLFDKTHVIFGATEETVSLDYAALGNCKSTLRYSQPTSPSMQLQNALRSSRKRDGSSVRLSRNKKRRNSALEAVLNMHSNWLNDPNWVGSSIANLFESVGDVSSMTTPKRLLSVENVKPDSLAQISIDHTNDISQSAFPNMQSSETNYQDFALTLQAYNATTTSLEDKSLRTETNPSRLATQLSVIPTTSTATISPRILWASFAGPSRGKLS